MLIHNKIQCRKAKQLVVRLIERLKNGEMLLI